jgi:hypothetical protein
VLNGHDCCFAQKERMIERIVEFGKAWDKRDSDPTKNYGIGAVSIRFVLKGIEGAVQFLLLTDWYLPHVTEELKSKPRIDDLHPMPADLDYHSRVARYEGQKLIDDKCVWLDGAPCYYDGSSLAADRVYQRLLVEGSEGVWAELEDYYHSVFGENG